MKSFVSLKMERQGGDHSVDYMDIPQDSDEEVRIKYSTPEEHEMSTDEYIEELKAEIERLRAKSGKASTSNSIAPSLSQKSMSSAARKTL